MTHTLALVSGDTKERGLLKSFLQKQGYKVFEIRQPYTAAIYPVMDSVDLILFDVASVQYGKDRDTVLQQIYLWRQVPIIVLMPATDADAAVPLLNAGIDNYSLKPIRRDELLAKVRALLRRTSRIEYQTAAPRLSVQELTIDLAARRAFVGAQDIRLTRKEFLLLAELALRVDAVCTHEELLAKVWGGEYWDANHYLHVYFGRIRKKMGVHHGQLIETVPGMGYMLHSKPTSADSRLQSEFALIASSAK